jgi:hypothetical protein
VEVDVSQITDSQASAANGSGTVTDFVDTVNRSIEDIVFAVLNKVDNLSTVITNRLTAIVASIQELFVSSFTILPGGSITVPAGENQIAGVGHLAVGTTEVFVRNDMIDENAVVYLTSTSEIDSPLYVASKVVGKGFYVRIKKSQENDVSFNWFFIKTYRPKNVQGDSEITTTVSGGSDSSTTTMTVLAPDEDSVVSSGQPVSEVSTSSESVDPVSETSTNSESVDEVSENSISSEDQGAVQPPIETSVEPTQSAAESAAQTATE